MPCQRKVFSSFVLLAGLNLLAPPASASLIGDTVDCDIQPNGSFWSCDQPSAVVGAGVEFILSLQSAPRFSVDVGADGFTISYDQINTGLGLGAGEVFTLSDMDWVGMPTGVITDAFLEVQVGGGLVDADVTFTDHSVRLDMNGTSWSPNDFVRIALVTDHSVPEPLTSALLLMGLGGLALRRRFAQ